MFKQLKKRLLTINIISISLLMIIAFGSIYFVTYNRTTMDIEKNLNHLESTKPDGEEPPDIFKDENFNPDEDNNPLPEREISFVINLDENNTILSTHSFFEEDDDFYEQALALAQSNDSEKYFDLEGEKWAFRLVKRKNFNQIFFVEVSTQLNSMTRLGYTFLIVFLVMFILNYFFSNYMTNESIKPIRKAFDKQNQFISDASHEMKTPLAVISTNVDVLLNGNTDSKKWLNYIKSEVTRMGTLTENLLYLSQFDDQTVVMTVTEVNLSELCEHVLLGMEAVAFEKKRQLNYTIDPNIMVKGDKEQLAQVLLILVDNAIKYSNENGFVDVHLEKNNYIEISVRNDGPGIEEDHIDKIFNRFYKVDESRSKETGYGLGLSIAKSIVTHHKGKLICSSTIDTDTTFTIKLPK